VLHENNWIFDVTVVLHRICLCITTLHREVLVMKYLILLLALTGCGASNNSDTIPFPYQNTKELCAQGSNDPSKPTIYGYGDSTMAGNVVGCENSYIDLVANRFDYNIINKGSAGSGMFGQNQYYDLMTDIWPAGSIVVFVPGINDTGWSKQDLNGVAVYQQQYIQALTNVINRLASSNVIGFIGTPLPRNSNYESSVTQNDLKMYASINTFVVTQINASNVHLIDLNSWYKPTNINDFDWVHPNDLGNEEISKYVYKIIRNVE
jgi:lysophospholipase L1-like esterase